MGCNYIMMMKNEYLNTRDPFYMQQWANWYNFVCEFNENDKIIASTVLHYSEGNGKYGQWLTNFNILTRWCIEIYIWYMFPLLALNSSPLRAAYMHQWTESALVQIMACRRIQNTKCFHHENASEVIVCEMAAILSRGRWVKVSSSYIHGVRTLSLWCLQMAKHLTVLRHQRV